MFYYLGIETINENQMVEGEYDSYSSEGYYKYSAYLFVDLTTFGIEYINVDADKEIIDSFFDNCITEEQFNSLLIPITKGFYYIGDITEHNDLYKVYKDFETGRTLTVWNKDQQPKNACKFDRPHRELTTEEQIERNKKPHQIPYEEYHGQKIYTEKYYTRKQYRKILKK